MDNKQDFDINWNKNIPDSNTNPATQKEIKDAMEKVREQAKVLSPGSMITLALRREVADVVAAGINSAGIGSAITDACGDATFDEKKGFYISVLYVAKDNVALNAYLDEI